MERLALGDRRQKGGSFPQGLQWFQADHGRSPVSVSRYPQRCQVHAVSTVFAFLLQALLREGRALMTRQGCRSNGTPALSALLVVGVLFPGARLLLLKP